MSSVVVLFVLFVQAHKHNMSVKKKDSAFNVHNDSYSSLIRRKYNKNNWIINQTGTK